MWAGTVVHLHARVSSDISGPKIDRTVPQSVLSGPSEGALNVWIRMLYKAPYIMSVSILKFAVNFQVSLHCWATSLNIPYTTLCRTICPCISLYYISYPYIRLYASIYAQVKPSSFSLVIASSVALMSDLSWPCATVALVTSKGLGFEVRFLG